MKVLLTKRGGESNEHFKARLLFAKYLKSRYHEPEYLIIEEYPPYRPKARSDLVVIKYVPPRLKIEMWVEVQESPLNSTSWRKKLSSIKRNFRVDKIAVVLTEKTKNEAMSVLKILEELFSQFSVFVADTVHDSIFLFGKNGKLLRCKT